MLALFKCALIVDRAAYPLKHVVALCLAGHGHTGTFFQATQ